MLRRNAVGRQVFFAANRECPVFEELAGLVRKTAGLVDVVRTHCCRTPPHIGAAFILWLGIYGSVAAGTETARSDVDVMILGELPFAEAVKALAPARASLRREVNPTVMKSAEFLRKRLAKDNFVTTVWIAPPAVGDRQRP